MLFDQQFDMQATMFQPVGGMDRIPYAFAKSLGSIVKFNAPVTEIRKTAKGVCGDVHRRTARRRRSRPTTACAAFRSPS